MLKRKKTENVEEPAVGPRATASTPAAPALPSELTDAAEDTRTTCYPKDGDPLPPVAGQPRTTVYRQTAQWNRRTYDNIN